jgi:predicted RNA-binding protein YlxR (DUF448 family)
VSDPQRSCLGCRKKIAASDLFRLQLVLDDASNVLDMIVSPTSVGGRGAWLCRAGVEEHTGGVSVGGCQVLLSCAQSAKQKKAFARGFRRDVPSRVIETFLLRFS